MTAAAHARSLLALAAIAALVTGCGESQHDKELGEATALMEHIGPRFATMRNNLSRLVELQNANKQCPTLACLKHVGAEIGVTKKVNRPNEKLLGRLLKQMDHFPPKLLREAAAEYKGATGRDLISEVKEIEGLAHVERELP